MCVKIGKLEKIEKIVEINKMSFRYLTLAGRNRLRRGGASVRTWRQQVAPAEEVSDVE